MKTLVMSTRGFLSTFSLLYGALLVIVLHSAPVSATLCENRCEDAVPYLMKLKDYWRQNISKRVVGQDRSFADFLAALLSSTRGEPGFYKFRRRILNNVDVYKDCVKTCEHQHSKRSGFAQDTFQPRHITCLTPSFCL